MLIEQSIMQYLLSIPEIATMTGGKIFYRRAPSKATMPWVIITNAGGLRERLTQGGQTSPGWTEPFDTLMIYVESQEQFRGRDIAERVRKALENYRGDMGDTKDITIKTQTIRDLDGWQGSFRYLLMFHIKYIEVTNVAG
jgi:hypothetical protein